MTNKLKTAVIFELVHRLGRFYKKQSHFIYNIYTRKKKGENGEIAH